ncbi:MAG: hypothetical protein ACJARO_002220, partial [Bacteriovoracaceae bacterium]
MLIKSARTSLKKMPCGIWPFSCKIRMLGQNPWKIKMILGSSKDPVLIKKIYLRIWTLRDEVEAVISERISSGETDSLSVEDLIQEYKSRSPL